MSFLIFAVIFLGLLGLFLTDMVDVAFFLGSLALVSWGGQVLVCAMTRWC